MELQDVTVKVLYDFEYSTKDGKFVKINEGEKLYLIKKTNKDWWQVIRNKGKPFYVPASYVEIYKKIIINNDEKKLSQEQIIPEKEILKVRSKSENEKEKHEKGKASFVSVKQRALSIDNALPKEKPKVAKRTVFPAIPSYENIPLDNEIDSDNIKTVIENNVNQNLSSPNQIDKNCPTFEPPPPHPRNIIKKDVVEEDNEEADYVNLRPEGDGFAFDDEPTHSLVEDSSIIANLAIQLSVDTSPVITLPLDHSNNPLITCSSSKSSLNNTAHNYIIDDENNISHKNNNNTFPKSHSISSNSLDGMHNTISNTESIDIPKKIIKSISSENIKHCNKINKLIKSFSQEPSSLPNNYKSGVVGAGFQSKLNEDNHDHDELVRLKHNGSFKTKYEQEKWSKKLPHENESNNMININENNNIKKSLETVKESLNEIPQYHTNHNFLEDEDYIKTNKTIQHIELINDNRLKCKTVLVKVDNTTSDCVGIVIEKCTNVNSDSTNIINGNEPTKRIDDTLNDIIKKDETNDEQLSNKINYIESEYKQSNNEHFATDVKNIRDKVESNKRKRSDEFLKKIEAFKNNIETLEPKQNNVKNNNNNADISKTTIVIPNSRADNELTTSFVIESTETNFGSCESFKTNESTSIAISDLCESSGISSSNVISSNFGSSADSYKNNEFASESEHSGDVLSISDKGSIDSLLEFGLGKSGLHNTDDGDISSEEQGTSKKDELSDNVKVIKDKENKKRKTALIRNRRVESYRVRLPVKGSSPPPSSTSTSPQLQPVKELFGGWSEYSTTDGRIYYCNVQTGEKSWKPPRKRCNTDEDGRSGSSSPFGDGDEASPSPITEVPLLPPPPGWTRQNDPDTGLPCYVNSVTGVKWFSSNDIEGRMYFFEENSNESSWTLPEVRLANNTDNNNLVRSTSQEFDPNVPQLRQKSSSSIDKGLRNAKSKSLVLLDPVKKPAEPPPLTPLSKNWPQLWDGHMCVLREGTLTRTKITEHGKRLRKNWATSHVVLTELFLLFFKDAKQFHTMKTGGCVGRPELCVDLNGALIDRGDKISSRKQVFLISTLLQLQVLIQFESSQHADSWLLAIHNVIKNLPSGVDNCSRIFKHSPNQQIGSEPSDSKKSKISRSKSVKLKKDGSIEDLTVTPAERQTKIKARLKKFFNRRPTMEHLVKKGIWKDEPAFGCFLEKVCPNESPRVPQFVQKCIQCIERSEENLKTDGLYRASGNLSQVQKIRLQVDQNNLAVLDQEEDVHVLTGALKLFFRELKEPLIPYHAFNKALKASTNHNRKEKLSHFRDIAKTLPTPNHDTFKYLLQHLLRVTKYKEFNRMHIPNLAIVFGPTLMWPEQESMNMALDLMQQNLVIECFLVEFDHIFR